MDKDNTHTHNIKNKDLLHINDVIFKDSIQSAIIPNKDISSSLNEDSIGNDAASSSILEPSVNEALDINMTDAVKVSSALNNVSFDDDVSIKEMASKSEDNPTGYPISSPKKIDQNHMELLEDLERIPDRMAFKISEVSDLTRIKSYVLRYWESEFEQLKPKKAINNRRMYTQKDVTTVMLIKKLLYRDKYSIEGAKKALKHLQAEVKKEHKVSIQSHQQQKAIDHLKDLISGISSLKKSLCESIED